jgi:DNA/RNA endonuclease YhcR with UshA esterase domain
MKRIIALMLAALLACALFAACGKTEPGKEQNDVTYDLAGAVAYVEGLYKDDLSVTAVDFDVVSQVMIAGVAYQIDWSVDTDKVTVGTPANGVVTIGVDEKSPETVEYKLTATVKAGDGTTQTVTFKLSVPEYAINSHEEYMAAKQDDMMTVEGIVVAINSKDAGNKYNHLFLADTSVTGGYYCYSVSQDPVKDLGIQVGMTVKVTGPVAPYSGMQEIKGGQVAIVDSTIKTVETVDITEKFTAGADLGVYVALPVVIKGVSIGAQDLEKDTSQYLYFAIGEKQGYLRTYITDFPTTLKAEEKANIDADHAAHFGYKADVTGILILYNGAPYLIPMSATPFTNYEEVKISNADKVKAEMDELKLDASFSSDATVELTAKGKYYDDVKITWKSEDTTGAATVADGKLTVKVPDKEITVKVTATVTCADVTKTKTFEIKLSKTITSIKELLAIGAAQESYTAEKYIAGGIITEIQNEKYGNIVIVDESGESILVYGTFIDGKKYGEAEGTKPVVGDYVVVVGVVGQYKGTPQMKNADITSFLAATTVKAALDAGSATESNVYTKENYMISGTVTEVQNEKYGNVVIKDAEGNSILLYGLYAQDGTRYDGMATKPVVGDTITVFGPAGNYKGTAQLKNATLIGLTKAAQ